MSCLSYWGCHPINPNFHATNYIPFLGINKKGATVAKPGNRRSSFVEGSSFNYRIMGTFTEIYFNGLWSYHYGYFGKYEFTIKSGEER